ncbi:MAG TPA: chemotaxis protein CheB [Methylophilaceae bacterium]|nr:chemotaxis protein CheB [Methylophilaceae bacterium]
MNGVPEIIVMGTSAGGNDALREIFSRLPADFPIPILVTIHIGTYGGILPELLQASSRLRVSYAPDNAPIEPGNIFIAPPNRHLLVEQKPMDQKSVDQKQVGQKKTRLSSGPKENFSRPAIDPLFRTAAIAYREKAIGVILTGHLDDGTVGLQAIKTYGGIAVVQHPDSAEAPSMPLSAMQYVEVDKCVPLSQMADTLIELAQTQVACGAQSVPEGMETEIRAGLPQELHMEDLQKIAQPSTYTCPECSGSLWEIQNAAPQRFRCHVGHAYTARTLQCAHGQLVDDAIWSAVRALHEKELLLKRLAQSASDNGRIELAQEYFSTAELASRHGETLRKILTA